MDIFDGAEIIDVYSFAQAVEDGHYRLADPGESRAARWKVPVYLSADAYARYVSWTEADAQRTGMYQDESGRLWDLLWMSNRAAARAARAPEHTVTFPVYVVLTDAEPGPDGVEAEEVRPYLCLGQDDDGNPIAKIFTVADA
ncbi:hypothetical protein GCM10022221_68000 [Actinocorallia aurea]